MRSHLSPSLRPSPSHQSPSHHPPQSNPMPPKKFGLLTKKQAFGSSSVAPPKALLNPGFGEDSDSESDGEGGTGGVSQSILAQAAKKKRLQEEELRKSGGVADEVYDYDRAHEEISKKREEEERKKKEDEFKSRSKSKYIGGE